MGKYDVQEAIERMKVLDSIKESYYDALDKADNLSINLYLEDVIRNVDFFEEDTVIVATKWINKQANFCFELVERFPEAKKEIDSLEAHLRFVVGKLKRYLETYYNIESEFTTEFGLVFKHPNGRQE